jgi:hypothetical protein
VGTVKKPSVFCEALFKLLWESALFADFHLQRQFPQAFFSFFFATLFFLRASLSASANFIAGFGASDPASIYNPQVGRFELLQNTIESSILFCFLRTFRAIACASG